MPDPLYLSLWFSSFEGEDILPHTLLVMRQFPFSKLRPGITSLALHPVSWNEATVLEEAFREGISPEQAVLIASDLIHEDYAYVFDTHWDLWMPPIAGEEWVLRAEPVKFIAHGVEFDEGVFEQEGHIEVDFGLDGPFLHEEIQLTPEVESRVRANVQQLVDFTNRIEKHSGAKARILWSESEENLAQKLLARLQRVQ